MSEPKQEIELSVVIPVFNAEATLRALIERLLEVLSKLEKPFEVILINDGSIDASWSILCELQRQHEDKLVVIDLMRNFGQHNAIMCGFRQCIGKYVVTMDDDLQNPPEEIPRLIESIEANNLDVVYGCYRKKKHEYWRNIGSELTQRFYRAIFKRDNGVSAFRIIRHELVHSVLTYNRNFTYLDGLFAWNTNRIGEVPVEHHTRQTRASGYSLRKLVVLALNLFTNFSLLPLQVVSSLGFIVAIIGFATGGYYVYQALLQNIAVPGYASTIVAVLILGGVQLLSLGMLGEYLGRVHLNINEKPQYVSREVRSGSLQRSSNWPVDD